VHARRRSARQPSPAGLAQAFTIGADFIGDDHGALVLGDDHGALVLGDNLFHGPGFGQQLQKFSEVDGAAAFAHRVADSTGYGVVEFDAKGRAVSLEEKPEVPRSNYAANRRRPNVRGGCRDWCTPRPCRRWRRSGRSSSMQCGRPRVVSS